MIQLVIFISTTILILAISHLPLYYTFIYAFGIVKHNQKVAFLLVLLFMSMSYIITTILARNKPNYFFEFLNYLSSLWLGLLSNLLIFIAFGWLLYMLLSFINIPLNPKIFGISIILLSLGLTFYGCYEAKNIRVKEIDVTINNLPDNWKGKSIVQITDVHLGHILKSDFMQKIVGDIKKIKPEMILITGDLFDGTGDHIKNAAQPLKELKPKHGKFYITGNHEIYLGLEHAIDAIEGLDINLMRDKNVVLDGLNLIGLDYVDPENKNPDKFGHNITAGKDFDKLTNLFSTTSPNIVMYHEPRNIKEIKNAGANLMLSGHTHRGQMWPYRYITWMIYGKYDYDLHTDGNFNIYTSNGVGTWGPPLRIFSRPEIVKINLK